MKCKPNCSPGGTLSKTRLASCSGILSGTLGGIHWRLFWWDTRRDPLANYSGRILGGIHWRATLGYSADTRRNPLVHWLAALVGYSAGSTGLRDTRRDPLASSPYSAEYSAGSTGGLLWWDTRRDPLASSPGGILSGILGGIHWRGCWWDTRRIHCEQLWRHTGRPLASCSGGILGGIHWRSALAG